LVRCPRIPSPKCRNSNEVSAEFFTSNWTDVVQRRAEKSYWSNFLLSSCLLFLLSIQPATSANHDAFFEAARIGDLATLQAALDSGVSINKETPRGQTALHFASRVEDTRKQQAQLLTVRFLLSKGANVNAHSRWGAPLHAAMNTRYGLPIALELINAGADVNARDSSDSTALDVGFRRVITPPEEFMQVLEAMLLAGLNVNAENEHGATLLHVAAAQRPLFVERLISAGAQLNTAGWMGKTALHFSSALPADKFPPGGDTATRALLKAGADAQIADDHDRSPLASASASGARILLEFGASPNGINNARPPLYEAAKRGRLRQVEQLIVAGADIHVRWRARTVMDELDSGIRQHVGSYDSASPKGKAGAYFEIADRLVDAGFSGDTFDKLAKLADIHPLRARVLRRHAMLNAVLFSPIIVPTLLVLLSLLVLMFRRTRLWKAATIASLSSALIGFALFLFVTTGMKGGNWGAALVLPGILASVLAIALASFVVIFVIVNWRIKRKEIHT
jgi:ankyrin repeat protein